MTDSCLQVLTAIATQRLVVEGKLRLDTTLADIWGDRVRGWNASVGTATISLLELLSHTAGLAKLPSNLHGTPANPFTAYTEQDLLRWACVRMCVRACVRARVFSVPQSLRHASCASSSLAHPPTAPPGCPLFPAIL